MVKNMMFAACGGGQQAQITNGGPTPLAAPLPGVPEEITISEVIRKLKRKYTKEDGMALGKCVAKRYRDAYNKEPMACVRYVDNVATNVKSYPKRHEGWITETARNFFETKAAAEAVRQRPISNMFYPVAAGTRSQA
eukprot:2098197-Rhodomonas_salina.1